MVDLRGVVVREDEERRPEGVRKMGAGDRARKTLFRYFTQTEMDEEATLKHRWNSKV